MDNIIQYLLEHTEVDIVALLLAIISGTVLIIRQIKKQNRDDNLNITVNNSSDVAINDSTIDKSKKS